MAIKTDDCDITETFMETMQGGNGDYYITLKEHPSDKTSGICKKFHMITYRMSMSGGFAEHHPAVKNAFAAFHRAMEDAGLNE